VARAPAAGSPQEHVRAWRPPLDGVREVFHARFVEHAYPPHTHDAWTVLLVDEGAVRYRLDRHDHGSHRAVVTVLPPHVAHDGRSAVPAGFRKQVLYLEPRVLGEEHVARAVDDPTVADIALVRALHAVHRSLAPGADALEAEARLALAVERLQAHLRARPGAAPVPPPDPRPAPTLAGDLRALLDAAAVPTPAAPPPTLAVLGRTLGASPTHLIRTFTRTFGVAPHAYLLARRVDAARGLLLAGAPPAEVAAATGFHDQPHLTRHFRRHVGTTPARYAGSMGKVRLHVIH
jgi:AraC-like DNA-binding protein